MDTNYYAENRLKKLSEGLHRHYIKSVAKADNLLVRYRTNFPEYTDHTILHSLQVTNMCNALIKNNIENLNEYELYILLMSSLLHDVGMGLDKEEIDKFKRYINRDNYSGVDFIREHHHELSALFVMDNYTECLIPDERIARAVAQVCKGHRKMDLTDKKTYPTDYEVAPGVKANLAYLSAVLRLADEMDISSERNLMLQYAGFVPKSEKSVNEFRKHCLLNCEIENDMFMVTAVAVDKAEYCELRELCDKLSSTFDYCQKVSETASGMQLGIKGIKSNIVYKNNNELMINIEKNPDSMHVKLDGNLTSSSAPYLENKLATRLHDGIKNLVLDFRNVQYVSSAGLRVILGAQKKMNNLHGKMGIINVSGDVMEIFKMTGFDNILTII